MNDTTAITVRLGADIDMAISRLAKEEHKVYSSIATEQKLSYNQRFSGSMKWGSKSF